MKNTLPNTEEKGFTLIELLIAITIVAILSVIGFSIFTNIQKGARDSQRRIEVDEISKNIESTFDPAARTYTYTQAQYDDDFPTNKPADPLRTALASATDARAYCVNVNTTNATPPTTPAHWSDNTACGGASGYNAFNNKMVSSGDNLGTNAVTCGAAQCTRVVNAFSWTICASLEANNSVYCKSSLQH